MGERHPYTCDWVSSIWSHVAMESCIQSRVAIGERHTVTCGYRRAACSHVWLWESGIRSRVAMGERYPVTVNGKCICLIDDVQAPQPQVILILTLVIVCRRMTRLHSKWLFL